MPELRLFASRLGFLPLSIALLVVLVGCTDSQPAARTSHSNPLAIDAVARQEVFEHAIDNLHRLEQFQPQAMLDLIRQQLNESVDWNRAVDWQSDPLVDTLPEQVRDIELLRSLEDLKLNVYDATHLQETVTLQGISRVAVGGATSDVERARLLFDWVVRNVQFPRPGDLVDSSGQSIRVPHFPMEILFFGRGDSIDRAWAFVLLCRQQGLDAVVLALPGESETDPPRPWVVGVIIDSEIYLFDPTLGLPIPGKDGQGIATLAQVAADDSILRQLDLDDEHRYPVSSEQLENLTALVEASPAYLSRRMRVLEGKLAGEDKIVLSESPARITQRLEAFPNITQVRLWGIPYERFLLRTSPQTREATMAALQQEMLPYRFDLLPREYQPIAANLQRGRVLHLKGKFAAEEGEPSANRFYQDARLAEEDIEVSDLNDVQRLILHRAKEDASYWLGLIAFERGRYSTAIDHLKKRTLGVNNNSRWTAGAHYNIGRAHEAQGEADKAVEAYNSSVDAQLHGNQLRAKQLKPAEPNAPSEVDDDAG